MELFFFLRFYLFIFTERGGEGKEKEGKKHQCVVASCTPHAGDLACNPGMCPDWGSNPRPFGSQSRAQSTEPQQPGLSGTHDMSASMSNYRFNLFYLPLSLFFEI